MENVIRFYGKSKPFFEGSNFYPAKFKDSAGTIWDTTEHYFQAMKFEAGSEIQIGPESFIPIRKHIHDQPTPMKAANEGRRRDFPLRSDWEQVKDQMMYNALRYKFTQNPVCKQALLDTGDAELIEASPVDYYWAEGADGTGKNMLGKLLVKLREEIRNEQ
jgi:ribA/ribD-fused uncharacterized protein